MKHNNKSAFAIAELVVVGVILLILGIFSSILLEWYALDTRNTKRITDVNNLESAIALKNKAWEYIMVFVGEPSNQLIDLSVAWVDGTEKNYAAWIINYKALWLNAWEFQDPDGDNYRIGATTTGEWRFELWASLETEEKTRIAFVKGSYNARTIETATIENILSIQKDTITVNESDIRKLKTGDLVNIQGNPSITQTTVKSIDEEGFTITFNTDMTAITQIALAQDESIWLIADKSSPQNNNIVTDKQSEFLPY